MNRTISVKLNLTEQDVHTLRLTQKIASQVFNDHVEWSFKNMTWSKIRAHKEMYDIERKKYNEFPSAMLQTVRDTSLETIKALKFKFRPKKSENSSLRYDKRLFSLRGQQLALSSIDKRIKCIISFPKWCDDIIKHGNAKQVQLCWDKKHKQFRANIVFKLEDIELKTSGKTIGLDRGLVNIITTSDGKIYSAKNIRKHQRQYLYLKRKLQTKGTRSAKRLLKKLSGKEKRFSKEQNHTLAKQLANQPNVQTYVIENLKGIVQKKRNKKLNKLLHSWSFFQLETFLTYKCIAKGIKIVKVDARYTSQACSCCGVIEKTNRIGGKYICKDCGFRCHADINAAINIRDRWISQSSQGMNFEQGTVNFPNGNDDRSKEHQVPRSQPRVVTI